MIGDDFWPSDIAFLDISKAQHLSDDNVRCTGVAVCDAEGNPCRIFHQGEVAHFFYEFIILGEIQCPAGGLQFENPEGKVIYGKNTFQIDSASPSSHAVGTKLRYHHRIKLEIEPGEYFFTIGCASVDQSSLEAHRSGALSHQEFSRFVNEHCRLIHPGSILVHLQRDGKLSHFGMVNLPGMIHLMTVEGLNGSVPPTSNTIPNPRNPTVFHITHWKAGSQWIHKILRELVPELIVGPQLDDAQFLYWHIQPGRVYPTLYLTKQQFDSVVLPADWRRFVVIRDLRDTLISGYFSLKYSHPILRYQMARFRSALKSLDLEDALVYLMDEWLPGCAKIQLSWLESGEPMIRYEDLLERDSEILGSLLSDHCGIPVAPSRIMEIVKANRFENLTGGRRPGHEDRSSHERKGVSGDWLNYFTPKIRKAFKARYGGVLIATGYEKDLDW